MTFWCRHDSRPSFFSLNRIGEFHSTNLGLTASETWKPFCSTKFVLNMNWIEHRWFIPWEKNGSNWAVAGRRHNVNSIKQRQLTGKLRPKSRNKSGNWKLTDCSTKLFFCKFELRALTARNSRIWQVGGAMCGAHLRHRHYHKWQLIA